MMEQIVEVGFSILVYLAAIVVLLYCLYAALIIILNEVPSIPIEVQNRTGNYILYYRGEEVREGDDFTLFVGILVGILLVSGTIVIILGAIGVALGIPALS